LGEVPPELECLRLIQEEIPARSGSALGKLYAAFQPSVPAQSEEKEALLVGTRLATLAIETRKLNADLRRRSEYDLLTDIPNRFAMEKFIEEKIEEAAKTGGKLGLIYIDLDKFKPINDTYGHHVGDLFLQAVARRMCRQLLGSDLLARLGGDEFAALVQLPHGVSDLKTIVARLDQCFLDPFVIEEHAIHGAASIGYALYPQDGVTQDELLKAADAAMYATKNVRK
jgi:diguanylate cyclase (GGDEF)-like protein